MRSALLAALTCLPLHAATPLSGSVYQIGAPTKVLYNFRQERSTSADTESVTTWFTEPTGAVAVIEQIEFEKGALKTYKIDQKQEGYTNLLQVNGNQANYTRTNQKTGDVNTNQDNWGPDFYTVPQLLTLAQKNWQGLMNGNSYDFRLAILEEMGTYGFTVSKDKETKVDGKETVILKVKPSSFFVSMVLNPFVLTVDKEGKKLLKITGASLPKIAKGPNEFRDLEADTVYIYDPISR